MSKNRAMPDSSLSDYYFAVSPLSLQFEREYKTRFHLYFQKNLQIISKYESPVTLVQKNEIVHFAPPAQLQHFRIPNQKNMDYQWSLYIFRVDIQGDNEQFVEGQKISLKDEWSAFKATKGAVYEKNVKFNNIRCKLNYLVVLGGNNQELKDSAQKYFDQNKMSVITTDEKNTVVEVQAEKQEVRREEESNPQSMAAKEQPKVKIGTKTQQIRVSEVIQRGKHSFQNQMNLKDKKNHLGEQLHIKEEQNIRLSNSQLEIGQQIESIVNERESSLNGKMILQPDQPTTVIKLQIPQQKSIKMTSSQLLNSKNQVIVPPHKQKRYILAFIGIIVLIVASGVWILGSSGPKISQKVKNKRQKNPKKDAKQTQPKKVKSKK